MGAEQIPETGPATRRRLRTRIYDLFSVEEKILSAAIYEYLQCHGVEKISRVVYDILRDIAELAIENLYKRLFATYVVAEMGMDDATETDWLPMYEAENNSHRGENFAQIAREKDCGIDITLRDLADHLRISVMIPRQLSMEQRLELANFRNLVSETNPETLRCETYPPAGRAMLLMKSLNAGIENLVTRVGREYTMIVVRLPWSEMLSGQERRGSHAAAAHAGYETFEPLLRNLNVCVVVFDEYEKLLSHTPNLLEILGYPPDFDAISTIIPQRFFKDIFRGLHHVRVTGRFEHYRTRLKLNPANGIGEVLFHVSGAVDKNGLLTTMWQPVVLRDKAVRLTEGSIFENLRLQNITRLYVPQSVRQKAREMIAIGRDELPNEIVDATIVFADIVGFTKLSSEMPPVAVVMMLNTSLGLAASSFTNHGGIIDKFLGDGMLALFKDPHDAIAAAIEAQNLFGDLNAVRLVMNEPPIRMRIGIHSGSVIMGNIGSDERLDWTAIGDVVNTASRIEQGSVPGEVLISDATHNLVRTAVDVSQSFDIRVKGKSANLRVHLVDAITRTTPQGPEQIRLTREKTSILGSHE